MILVDCSQVFIANAMVNLKYNDNKLNVPTFKHMVYSSLLEYKLKHQRRYGEMILCMDDKRSWRYDRFEHYKATRRKTKATDVKHDWKAIYAGIDSVKEDLKQYFPWKVMDCNNTEADDIIGVVALMYKGTSEKILILSADKDYFQLHENKMVRQYSPLQKKMVAPSIDAKTYLREHILRGDRGDGIPNFLSPDNALISNVRQSPITKKKLAEWNGKPPEEFCDEGMMRNFHRNELLISFEKIPVDISKHIHTMYAEDNKVGNKMDLLSYLVKNKYKELITDIEDF
jgi:5'-3' exonuclease